MNALQKRLKDRIVQSIIMLLSVMAIVFMVSSVRIYAQHEEGTSVQAPVTKTNSDVVKYGLFAAALAFGLGAVGAGMAISHVGAAAMGAIAEKPEIAGQALIFIALAEGLVVFGFITALMILGKI